MNFDEIKPYIEKGLINMQAHPEDADVCIFNYTQTCQFSQAWDDVTRQCRGLIMNIKTGEILARPFPKFFNYQEHVAKSWPIPTGVPVVQEKLDGSLGILYSLNGKAAIATRGSFTSEQALWATEWWHANMPQQLREGPFLYTHLFEIIYPANRIVVNYDFSGLVHLTSLDHDGKVVEYLWNDPVRRAMHMACDDVAQLMQMDIANSEGFVLYYPNDNVRMKIKFAEYVRLHKLVTGLSEIAIWEHMRDGKTLADLLEKVPDEFFKWATDVQRKLHDKFQAIQNEANEDYVQILDSLPPPPTKEEYAAYRKSFAIAAQSRKYAGILFAMLDHKPYYPIIWKMIRPHGASAFKKDIDA